MEEKRIIDGHVHIYSPEALPFLQNYISDAGLSSVCIASCGCFGDGRAAEQLLLSLLLKRRDPSLFAYGSLIYPETPVRSMPGDWAPEAQAKTLMDMGFDGVKMLETKPGSRKMLGLPLDSPVYEPFFQYLEENRVPMLWHVADPRTFWDKAKAPAFAVENGWTYDDTYLTFEQSMDEVFHVLDRHPRLQVAFAHFFFHSDAMDAAQAILDKYDAVCFDITPGIEMYENFSLDPAAWRAFFTKNAPRILLGTDSDEFCTCVMCETEKSPVQTLRHIRRFLETDDTFSFWDRTMHGVALPETALAAIYAGNFIRRTGAEPRPVNEARIRAYAAPLLPYVQDAAIRAWIEKELAL